MCHWLGNDYNQIIITTILGVPVRKHSVTHMHHIYTQLDYGLVSSTGSTASTSATFLLNYYNYITVLLHMITCNGSVI